MRMRRDHDDRAWLAWHVAALVRCSKKLPDLKKLQAPEDRRQPSMEADLAAVMAWNAAINRRV